MSQEFELCGKYILLEKLSQGGMAEIYLAKSSESRTVEKFVAIKKILPKHSKNRKFIEMFIAEARASVNLSHSNIVSIHEFGLSNEHFFLVMSYIPGKNLKQIISKVRTDKKRLSIPQIMFIIKSIALGLDHAHKCLDGTTGKPLNIIHRDISPQNIMLSFEAEPLIIDFGIAKIARQLESTEVGTLKGKFSYMSPEQVTGEPISPRTDIFSLGIIMWELLANRRLFSAKTEVSTLENVRNAHIPRLTSHNPTIPLELEEIVFTALAKDPNDRYQFAADFHRSINQLLNKMFPNFSQHDFSSILKSLYADDILEMQSKQIEYFKIKLNNDGPFSNSTACSEITMDFPNLPNINILPQDEVHKNLELEDSFNSDKAESFTNSNSKTEATEATEEEHVNKVTNSEQNNNIKNYSRSQDSYNSKYTESSRSVSVYKRALPTSSNRNYTRAAKPPASGKGIKKTTKFIFLAIALFAAIFLSYDNSQTLLKKIHKIDSDYILDQIDHLASMINQNEPSAITHISAHQPIDFKEIEQDETASTKIRIHVNSKPSGAEIFINGKSIHKSTPSFIEVDRKKPFELKFVKENYITYRKSRYIVNDLNQRTFSAHLQKSAIAYLNINVTKDKNRVGSKVFINRIEISSETLPIKNFAVRANEDILIEVKNPVTSTYDAKIVNLRTGVTKKILFLLRTPLKRSPSQR